MKSHEKQEIPHCRKTIPKSSKEIEERVKIDTNT